MSSQSKLIQIVKMGSELTGNPIPLGFDLNRIAKTIARIPGGIDDELKALFSESWPSDYFLGAIEIIGPERINMEHEQLYPGLTVIRHGFLCIGSDGAGTMYTYCVPDHRVYLLANENFTDSGLRSANWDELETTPENIKSVAVRSWDSLEALFDWALVELQNHKDELESHFDPAE